VDRIVELNKRNVQQEIAHKQMIMSWSHDKYNISRVRIVKSAAHHACNGIIFSEREFFMKRLLNSAGFNLKHFYISKEIMLDLRFILFVYG
jgi:hypothetical protein